MKAKNTKQTKKILIVDEDLPVHLLLSARLSDLGHEVLKAENGIEALAILEKHKPDLVVTELVLGDLNGYSLVESLRRHTHGGINGIPVVILTNLWSNLDRARAEKLGIHGFLVKSQYRTEEILERILAVLKS